MLFDMHSTYSQHTPAEKAADPMAHMKAQLCRQPLWRAVFLTPCHQQPLFAYTREDALRLSCCGKQAGQRSMALWILLIMP